MPTLQDSVSVAANATSANVLEGQLYRFVPRGTRVTVSLTGSAIGLRSTLLNGVPVVDDQAMNIQNRFPEPRGQSVASSASERSHSIRW